MTNDLIIGIASGYLWNDVEPFVVSLRRSGYDGRCILLTGKGPHEKPGSICAFRPTKDLEQMLHFYKVATHSLGTFTEHPIVARFPAMADLIRNIAPRFALCLDVKDIVFQSDPTVWLENNIGSSKVIVTTEEVTYANSSGNMKNMIEAYGHTVAQNLSKEKVVNGGVITGFAAQVETLLRQIHSLCRCDLRLKKFKPTYSDMLPDQSALNVIARQMPFNLFTKIVGMPEGFAFQNGHRHVGARFENGQMFPKNSEVPYTIFHQYVCDQTWWREVDRRYRES
jgi:hypothetical protein